MPTNGNYLNLWAKCTDHSSMKNKLQPCTLQIGSGLKINNNYYWFEK